MDEMLSARFDCMEVCVSMNFVYHHKSTFVRAKAHDRLIACRGLHNGDGEVFKH